MSFEFLFPVRLTKQLMDMWLELEQLLGFLQEMVNNKYYIEKYDIRNENA